MFVFSYKLHISPEEMGRMSFYDIMLLYERYNAYIEEENERDATQQKAYEEQYNQQQFDPGSMMRSMSNNMPNMDTLTKGLKM
jgi:hypothetical protein